jgi:HSP20 family protein
MASERLKVSPDIVSYTDDCHSELTVEIALPGVKKEDIQLKLHDDSMYLTAPKDDLEYVTTLSFCCPVNPQAAKASYENGLLRLVVAFKDPLEDAVTVAVS